MASNYEVEITTRDRLLRAWENSKELVRDFENYAHEAQDDKQVSELFRKFAEDEGLHAAKLNEMLHQYQSRS